MMDDMGFAAGAGLFCFLIGLIGGMGLSDNIWRGDVISRGFAEYCPEDGRFAFTGECEK